MSVKATYTCDNCGATKGETNHWFAIRANGNRSTLLPTFTVGAFIDAGADDSHLCGESCLSVAVSKAIQEILKAADQVEQSRLEDDEVEKWRS